MQAILQIGGTAYSIAENRHMDVNIITKLVPNEDGLLVLHEFVDFLQDCDCSEAEIQQYIENR